MDEEIRTYVRCSRLSQGLPPRVTDPNVLAAIQRVLCTPHKPNTVGIEARAASDASRADNNTIKKSA